MKKILKRALPILLAIIMVTGLLPFDLLAPQKALAADVYGINGLTVKSKMISGKQFYYFSGIAIVDDTYKSIVVTYPRELTINTASLPYGWEITFTESVDGVAERHNSATITTGASGAAAADIKDFLEDETKIWLSAPNTYRPGSAEITLQVFIDQLSKYVDENGEDHYYEFVRTNGSTEPYATWLQAYNYAYNRILPGTVDVHGYLATITSLAEQTFIYHSIATTPGWLGGTRMVYTQDYIDGSSGAITNKKIGANGETTISTRASSATDSDYDFTDANANEWYWANGPEATAGAGGAPLVFYSDFKMSADVDKSVEGVFNFFDNKWTFGADGQNYADIGLLGSTTTFSNGQPDNGFNSGNAVVTEVALQFAYQGSGWNNLRQNDYNSGLIRGYYVEWTPGAIIPFGASATMPPMIVSDGDWTYPTQNWNYSITPELTHTFTVTNIGDNETEALNFVITDTKSAFNVTGNYFTGSSTLASLASGSLTIAPKPGLPVSTYTALIEISEADADNYVSWNVSFTVRDYALTTSSNAGTVTPVSKRVGAGETVTYSVTTTTAEDDNYYFNNWTATGGASLSVTNAATGGTFTMPANDVTLSANFLPRPTVASVSPAGDGAARDGDLIITFSEPMDDTVKGSVTLTGGAGSLAAKTAWTWTNNYRTLIVPYTGLAWNTAYNVAIGGDFKNTHASNTGISVASPTNAFRTRAQSDETITYEYYLPGAGSPFITQSEGKAIGVEFDYTLLNIPYHAVDTVTVPVGDIGGGALNAGKTAVEDIELSAATPTTLKIQLKSTLTSVTVNAVDDSASGAVLKAITIPNVVIGTAFTFPAPIISGYQLASGQSVTGALPNNGGFAVATAADNVITIHYIPSPSGNTVYNYEIPASWVGNFDLTAFKANPTTYEYPASSGIKARLIERYTATGNLGDTVPHIIYITGFTYSSGDPTTPVITANTADNIYFFYTPNMVNITINTYLAPATTTQVPGTSPIVKAYQEGDYVTIDAPTIENYTLSGDPTQSITIPSSATSVAFYYTEKSKIAVSILYEDGSGNALGSVNSVTGYVGSVFTAAPATFDGYTFTQAFTNDGDDYVTSASPVVITVDSNANKNKIKFVYADNRHTVAVSTKKGAAAAVATDPVKFVDGDDAVIYPPFIEGYVLTGYILDGLDSDTPTAVSTGFTGVEINDIDDDHDVIFVYDTIDDAANSKYLNITIEGVDSDDLTPLYSYEKRIAKSALPYTLLDGTDVFNVPGYSIDAGQNHTVAASDLTNVYTFKYTTTATIVTIKLQDDDSGDPVGADTFTEPATKDSPFTYLAPFVDGYKLTTASNIGRVNSVAADGSSEIVFEYAQIVSKVTVIFKEMDTNGDVIRSDEIASPTQGGASFAPPATLPGYYTLQTDSESVPYNFDGTNALTIEAYYDKDLVDIAITATDATGAADLSAYNYTLHDQRKGEVATITAPPIPSYIVVNGSPRLVIADSGTIVNFRYRSTTTSGVTVEIRLNTITGTLLQQYVIPATVGEPITVDPATISIAGYDYKPTGSVLSAIAGNVSSGVGGKIIVLMTDERHTVTVTNNINSDILTYNVLDGEDLRLPIPYISGYVPVSYKINDGASQSVSGNSITLLNVASDTVVVFTYNRASAGGDGGGGGGTNTGGKDDDKTGDKDDGNKDEDKTGDIFDGGVSDRIKNTLETVDHIKYIGGYGDGRVGPNDAITRAEVAMIFFRLLKDPTKNETLTGNFSDVSGDAWYAQAVNYLARMGIIKGFTDGTFKPNQYITRAEFAAVASRFDDIEEGIENIFSDIPREHWAYECVNSAYYKGWISGYPGGEFKPNDNITRAEVVKIVNKMLGRALKKEDISADLYTLYSDLSVNHWAFAEIIEASVEHTFNRDANGKEKWK
jgi:hypothetical protein